MKIRIEDDEAPPVVRLCWTLGPTMERCDRKAGHGPLPGTANGHTWEVTAPAPVSPPS